MRDAHESQTGRRVEDREISNGSVRITWHIVGGDEDSLVFGGADFLTSNAKFELFNSELAAIGGASQGADMHGPGKVARGIEFVDGLLTDDKNGGLGSALATLARLKSEQSAAKTPGKT